jgi:hypothetical protein
VPVKATEEIKMIVKSSGKVSISMICLRGMKIVRPCVRNCALILCIISRG